MHHTSRSDPTVILRTTNALTLLMSVALRLYTHIALIHTHTHRYTEQGIQNPTERFVVRNCLSGDAWLLLTLYLSIAFDVGVVFFSFFSTEHARHPCNRVPRSTHSVPHRTTYHMGIPWIQLYRYSYCCSLFKQNSSKKKMFSFFVSNFFSFRFSGESVWRWQHHHLQLAILHCPSTHTQRQSFPAIPLHQTVVESNYVGRLLRQKMLDGCWWIMAMCYVNSRYKLSVCIHVLFV